MGSEHGTLRYFGNGNELGALVLSSCSNLRLNQPVHCRQLPVIGGMVLATLATPPQLQESTGSVSEESGVKVRGLRRWQAGAT